MRFSGTRTYILNPHMIVIYTQYAWVQNGKMIMYRHYTGLSEYAKDYQPKTKITMEHKKFQTPGKHV
jgi:hypothetical protein